jgi:hypothetical protein
MSVEAHDCATEAAETADPVAEDKPKINLRRLDYSPVRNPLIEPQTVHVKKKWVKSGRSDMLLDPATGELAQGSVISTLRKVDDAHFVKVFASGVAAAFDLSKTAARVFNLVLREYENTPLTGGYADSLTLYPYSEKVDGKDVPMIGGRQIDMSVKTFQRGLAELLEKNFLYPKQPHIYWVNPALFFKGDRVRFVTEYERVNQPSIKAQLSEDEEVPRLE